MSARHAVFVISLGRPAARRDNAKRLAALPGGRILPAVDGRALSAGEVAAAFRREVHAPCYPFALTPGEIGVFLSHRRAWAAIVAERLDFGVVLEDDAAVLPGFADAVAALASAREDWGVVLLHHGRAGADRRRPPSRPAEGSEAPPCPTLWRATPPRLAMVAVAVSRPAAELLLSASAPFDRPVDAFLQMEWLHGVSVSHLDNAVAQTIAEDVGGSTIQVRRSSLGPAAIRRQIDRWVYRRRIAALSRAQNRSPEKTRS